MLFVLHLPMRGIHFAECRASFSLLLQVLSLLACAAAWGLTAVVLFKERKGYVARAAWLLRAAVVFAVVGQLAKLRFVIILQHGFDT